MIKSLHWLAGNQVRSGKERHVLCPRPFFKCGEIGSNDHASELAAIANNGGFRNQRVRLECAFDRLWRDEFPAGGFDQVFLAVGDAEKSVGINASYVAGPEPTVRRECCLRLGRYVPIA